METTIVDARTLLRHLLATLAYRAAKVLRETPPGFAHFSSDTRTRTPVQIVAHLGDLMGWATRLARGEYRWQPEGSGDWDQEVGRFIDGMAELDRLIASEIPPGN